PVDQIKTAANRRAVAVDADDPGSPHVKDRPAVAPGAKGRVNKNAAVARSEPLDGLTAQHGDMARTGSGHAPAPGVSRRRERNLDADRPMASQISALCRAFPAEKPPPTAATIPRPRPRTLIFRRNWLGC